MTAIKKAPVCQSGKTNTHRGHSELELLSNLKQQQIRFTRGIVSHQAPYVNLIRQLNQCGNTIYFRHFETGEYRLAGGYTCKHHLFCPSCNYRRAKNAAATYGLIFEHLSENRPHMVPVLLTMYAPREQDPFAIYSNLKQWNKQLLPTRGRLVSIAGGTLNYSFQLVPEGYSGVLYNVALLDCSKLLGQGITEERIRLELEESCPDLPFTVRLLDLETADEDCDYIELLTIYRFTGLLSHYKSTHAQRWNFCMALRGESILHSYGCFGNIRLPNDSADRIEPSLRNTPFAGETYHFQAGSYHLQEVSEGTEAVFPLEDYRPGNRKCCQQRPLHDRYNSTKAYRALQNRFSRLSRRGIEVDQSELPVTPQELIDFRVCHGIRKTDLAEWSRYSIHLFDYWESDKIVPPFYAGLLYLLYVAERHTVEQHSLQEV